ncbi:MAG: Ig-like domain-containing protein [Propionibacteriales bacterium]|nr:Ig-like domain-containing protein [Propionibacteriales bacterium]
MRIEAGWTAQRALYNVVRGAELADSKIQAVFGPTGFVCSDDALALIEAAGFGQLDSEADGGECGVQTTLATTNFQVNGEETATSTVLAAVSNNPGQVTLTATVTSSPAATGTVTFKEGANVVASGVALSGGVATTTITGVTAGAHTYTAVFAPGAGFGASQDDADPVTVAAVPTATSTSTTASSPSARTVSLRANVTPIAGAGTVTFRDGATVVATGVPVINGVATKSLTSVKPGNHSYAAQFVPTNAAAFAGSTDATPASVLVRTTASITESFPTATSPGARGRGTVTVTLLGTTTKATGKVVLKVGTKVVGSGTLSKGKVTITLIKMSRGKKKVVITWAGNTLAPKKTKSFYITQR